MTVGPAPAVANDILDLIIGTGVTVFLATGDPGAAGTANACTGAVASSGRNAGDSSPSAGVADFNESALIWEDWDGGSVNVTHVVLKATTGGAFRQSLALTAPVSMTNGATFVLDVLQLTCNKAA